MILILFSSRNKTADLKSYLLTINLNFSSTNCLTGHLAMAQTFSKSIFQNTQVLKSCFLLILIKTEINDYFNSGKLIIEISMSLKQICKHKMTFYILYTKALLIICFVEIIGRPRITIVHIRVSLSLSFIVTNMLI